MPSSRRPRHCRRRSLTTTALICCTTTASTLVLSAAAAASRGASPGGWLSPALAVAPATVARTRRIWTRGLTRFPSTASSFSSFGEWVGAFSPLAKYQGTIYGKRFVQRKCQRVYSSSIPEVAKAEAKGDGEGRTLCLIVDPEMGLGVQKKVAKRVLQEVDVQGNDSIYVGLATFPRPFNDSITSIEHTLRLYYEFLELLITDLDLPPTFNSTVLFPRQLDRFLREYNVDAVVTIPFKSSSSGIDIEDIQAKRNELGLRNFERITPPEIHGATETDDPSPLDICANLDSSHPVEQRSIEGIHHPQHVCVGGTFDRLHGGHKLLLSVCAVLAAAGRKAREDGKKTPRNSGSIVLGLASGGLLAGKVHEDLIEPFEARESRVLSFLSLLDPTIDVHMFALEDPFGPSVEIMDLTTLVVSEESQRGGEKVNEERIKRGMQPLEVHVVGLVPQSQKEIEAVLGESVSKKPRKVSSTDIREYLASVSTTDQGAAP